MKVGVGIEESELLAFEMYDWFSWLILLMLYG